MIKKNVIFEKKHMIFPKVLGIIWGCIWDTFSVYLGTHFGNMFNIFGDIVGALLGGSGGAGSPPGKARCELYVLTSYRCQTSQTVDVVEEKHAPKL